MALIDAQYFTQIINQLNALDARATSLNGQGAAQQAALQRDIQAVIDNTFPGLKTQYADMLALQARLAPALALLTLNPSDLPSVISFITNLVEHYLTPQLLPYTTATAQMTSTTAQVATLVAKIESVASKVPGFTPSIPSFP